MSSIDDHEGDTLILILKGRMLAYGIPTRDNYAPLWLKDDADLNYLTCYDYVMTVQTVPQLILSLKSVFSLAQKEKLWTSHFSMHLSDVCRDRY